jgi:hypothetical protein
MTHDPDAQSWELPVAGLQVVELWLGFQLYLIAQGAKGDDRRMQINIGGLFTFEVPDGTAHRLDPGHDPWSSFVPMLGLQHVGITSAVADRTATLRVRYSDGAALSVGPHPKYENWEVVGPDKLYLVAPPGGGDPRIAS